MTRVPVILLWHMHQPLYVLPGEKAALMPWVHLHCVKGYSDMIALIDHVPEMRAVFNFTPVLLQQIHDLATGAVIDSWLELSRKDAADLDDNEKLLLLEHFFKAHWDNMVRAHPRYAHLLEQRGTFFDRNRFERNPSLFSTRDYRDLQVWFNLAWCGHAMLRRHPELRALIAKGENFTEEDKHAILDAHVSCLRTVLEAYKKAEEQDRIETTTTPYFHPILPLLIDTELAARRMPGRQLPPRFTAPEDAQWHVNAAIEAHQQHLGRRPAGMWPAEGSVAPEIIPLLAEAGIQYMFTDEGNLFHALLGRHAHPGVDPEHLALFQPWRAHGYDREITAFFRERALSDFIGFNAARNPPEKAAEYLINKLAQIAEHATAPNAVITLALDGENAWEAFPDGGEKFLTLFYQGLCAHPRLQPTLPRRFLEKNPHQPRLDHINTGSWINSDFDIWIGDAEENTAWTLLGNARAALLAAQHTLDPTAREAAWRSLYAAEGSDWFWWFGPDFHTDSQPLFDQLFRAHLARIYTLIGLPVPLALTQPIRKDHRPAPHRDPTSRITPRVNGRVNSYFEYIGAGTYDPATQSTAMYQSRRLVCALQFGNDDHHLYLRLDPHEQIHGQVLLDIIHPDGAELTIQTHAQPPPHHTTEGLLIRSGQKRPLTLQCANDQIFELAVPLQNINARAGEKLSFRIRLADENGIETERHPEAGFITTLLPDEHLENLNWQI